MFVVRFVIVFCPFTITGAFVTTTHVFVEVRFVLACKAKPVALEGHATETALLVNNLTVKLKTSTVKFAALTPVPPGATTLIGPVVALVGTTAVSCELFPRVKAAFTPLNCTEVAFVKLPPLIVTEIPTTPLPGVKLLTVGGREKMAELFMLPPGVVMEIVPLVALAGTVAVTEVLFTTVKLALAPLKLTSVALVKFTPLKVTTVPGTPLVGANPLMAGGRKKLVMLVTVPLVVVTLIGPLVAVGGTVAVI